MTEPTNNLFDLTDKVALITGSSRGIGLAMASGLAQSGAKVVLCGRKQEGIDEAVKTIRVNGGEATGIPAHMGRDEDLQALVNHAVETFGGVDILVNNAATNPVFGPLLDNDDAAFDKIMEVNVKGPLNLAKLVHPIMVSRGGGSIINVSSIGGLRPEPMLGLYSMSKAALISLTKVMAAEWGGDSVRVNVLCPGLIKTQFSQALWSNEKILNSVVGKLPLKRIAQPEELVGMTVYLASAASSYCTGSVMTVDGGHTI
ncbi:Gluconate 5-dehydrogenase [Symmachiella macrocystis]|uniref:Gluconate 5-dehydrogenase n=1 Tax=Symmachiella macrocystis TaxID=2527985 RepID=A0A5C6B6Y1_9PLAN|nr:glucose 1-dehydrogenase [Symmachiella macrocystis]TWU07046.1 Gluconate 5-dehydrogenase [Symmachiella macrocystis]